MAAPSRAPPPGDQDPDGPPAPDRPPNRHACHAGLYERTPRRRRARPAQAVPRHRIAVTG